MQTHTAFALLAFVLPVTGCALSAEEPSDPAESMETALSVGSNPFELPYHGGGGGSPADVACAPGDVAIGLFGSSEDVVNAAALDFTVRHVIKRVGLICAHVETDGRLTNKYTTAALGNATVDDDENPTPFYLECGSGSAMTGFRGRSGKFLDAVGVLCGGPFAGALGGGAEAQQVLAKLNALAAAGAGGDGGSPFSESCPIHFVVNRLRVRSGTWVDGANAFCVGLGDLPAPPPPPPPPAPVVVARPGLGQVTPPVTFCRACRRF